MQDTIFAQRIHIGFFGMRNAGKSSLVNAVTGQQMSVVSNVKGTTTDPVKKAMELLPLGPVVIIDTPGLDDEGELGELRIQKAKKILSDIDIAVVVMDAGKESCAKEEELLQEIKRRRLPFVIAYNKCDIAAKQYPFEWEQTQASQQQKYTEDTNAVPFYQKYQTAIVPVSALTGEGIQKLKETLGSFAKLKKSNALIGDRIEPNDVVLLVTPLDEAAPKGRLILPQQLVIRDILDHHGIVTICQDTELKETLASLLKKPKLVITDSQVFEKVDREVPEDIFLTSFSILMARYKGNLPALIEGARALAALQTGDSVLIAEGCTHHRQCKDIGTVKMPEWIRNYTKRKPEFHFTSGNEFPEDVSKYALIVHCGGCTLNEAAMKSRIQKAVESKVPIVNYGIAIAKMHGILERSIALFAKELS